MGRNTKIEWTDHTFNAWYGCTKVSAACKNCYAVRSAARLGVQWGDGAPRRIASERMWEQPRIWNRSAGRKNTRHRVFCSSLSDVFEDRDELVEPRMRLVRLILETPHLDWLLLTKRPENIDRFWPSFQSRLPEPRFPNNVWLGTTVEDQKTADERIPQLLKLDASVHFLSCEPLLESVDLSHWVGMVLAAEDGRWLKAGHPDIASTPGTWNYGIDWVIAGGESGPGSRPMHPDWARRIRDQCVEATSPVPFFFKQWGDWLPNDQKGRLISRRKRVLPIAKKTQALDGPAPGFSAKVGKKNAGRMIDGREWNQLPKQARFL